MKNILYLLLIPFLFLSCSDDDEEIIKLDVDDYNVNLYIGETSDVVISGGKGKLSYGMDDATIADVSLNGRVITITGKEKGYSKLRITDEGNNTCELNVNINTKSINVFTDIKIIEELETSISLPDDGDYTVTSSDESIATAVIKDGEIVFLGKKAGHSAIFTLRNIHDKAQIAFIDVKVLYELKLSHYEVNVNKGETKTIYVARGNGGYSCYSITNMYDVKISGDAIQITGRYSGSESLLIGDAEKMQRVSTRVIVN